MTPDEVRLKPDATSLDAARLVASLERLRRRAVVALAVRYVCAAVAVAVLGAEAVLMASATDLRPATLIAGVALAAVGAAAAAAFRAPAIRETAVAVDRRLLLQNRLITALQYRNATDEFSRLVVRDALSYADRIRPASAFPIHLPTWVRVAGVAVFAAPLVFVLATRVVPEFWQRASSGGAVPGPGALSIPSPAGSRGGTQARPGAAAAAIADGAPRGQVEEAPSSQSSRGRGSQSEQTRDSVDPSAAAPGGTADTAAAGSGARQTGAPPTGLTEGAGAGRGNGATGSAQTAQAGGLTGSPGGDADARQMSQSAEPARDPAYRTAWSASQRAIAQEHIPSRLREYVRQYFQAIRPPATPEPAEAGPRVQ